MFSFSAFMAMQRQQSAAYIRLMRWAREQDKLRMEEINKKTESVKK